MTIPNKQETFVINERIRADRVQLITAEGDNLGIVSRDVALAKAREAGLDLVLIADRGRDDVSVAKIIDYGKFLYERKKQQAEAKKKQTVVEIKELKLRPKIAENDYLTKLRQAIQFLEEGKRVKFTLTFRGREMAMRDERGGELMNRIQQGLEAVSWTQKRSLAHESDQKAGGTWSRLYYLKK